MTDHGPALPCSWCEYEIPPGDEIIVSTEPTVLCEGCADDSVSCYCCDSTFNRDETGVSVEGSWGRDDRWYCDSCSWRAYSCHSCDTMLDDHSRQMSDDNINVCESCAEHWWRCEDCSDLSEETFSCGDCDDGYHRCESCDRDHRNECGSRGVHRWDYKPHFQTHGTAHLPNAWFGVELETELNNADRFTATELMGSLWGESATYLKQDGSLSNGVEIVSMPMSLDYARQNLNRDVLRQLTQLGVRSWNTTTCGIHIHIDRRVFRGESHLGALMILIHRSQRQIEALVGRGETYYASYDTQGRGLVKQAAKKESQASRYKVVNLFNDNTVELRLFRGTLRADTILSHIELCAALVEFTGLPRVNSEGAVILTSRWQTFSRWVDANADRFPNLSTRINERVKTLANA